VFEHAADHHPPGLPTHRPTVAPVLDDKHSCPLVDFNRPWQTANGCKIRKHFTEQMRPSCGHQAHRWIAYIGLAIILYVACEMVYRGAYELKPVIE
jgi:hypothetical protein